MIKTVIVPAETFDSNQQEIIKEINAIDPRLNVQINRVTEGYAFKMDGEPDSIKQTIDLLNQF